MTTQHINSRTIELSPEGRKDRLADIVPSSARIGNSSAAFRVKEDYLVRIARFWQSGSSELTLFTIGSNVCHLFALSPEGHWSDARTSLVDVDGSVSDAPAGATPSPLTADRALILCDSHNRLQERDAASLVINLCARAPAQASGLDLGAASFSDKGDAAH